MYNENFKKIIILLLNLVQMHPLDIDHDEPITKANTSSTIKQLG